MRKPTYSDRNPMGNAAGVICERIRSSVAYQACLAEITQAAGAEMAACTDLAAAGGRKAIVKRITDEVLARHPESAEDMGSQMYPGYTPAQQLRGPAQTEVFRAAYALEWKIRGSK